MRNNADVQPEHGCRKVSVYNPADLVDHSRRNFLRWGAGLFAWGALGKIPVQTLANVPNRPSTSRTSREQAVRGIPLKSISEPLRSKIQKIVFQPTLYRRLPIQVIPCDPDLYVFLIRYPEVIVNMWQLMGVTKVTLKRTNAYSFDAQDGAGTVSQVELVYGTRDRHLFLAEGYYDGPLLPRRVTGRCVLLLTSAYSKDEKDRSVISNRLDVFVQIDNIGVEIVAKTLHPLMGKNADSNFAESTRFLSQVSHVAETNGPGVQRLVTRLKSIQPDVRNRFSQITATINQRSLMKSMVRTPEGPSARVSDNSKDPSVKTIIE